MFLHLLSECQFAVKCSLTHIVSEYLDAIKKHKIQVTQCALRYTNYPNTHVLNYQVFGQLKEIRCKQTAYCYVL